MAPINRQVGDMIELFVLKNLYPLRSTGNTCNAVGAGIHRTTLPSASNGLAVPPAATLSTWV